MPNNDPVLNAYRAGIRLGHQRSRGHLLPLALLAAAAGFLAGLPVASWLLP